MNRIVPVVEGHGEVDSVPILIRRYVAIRNPPLAVDTSRPIRVSRGRLVKTGELERAVRLASFQGDATLTLVLIDADKDCPATLGPELLARAQSIDRNAGVVLAKSEFESWFVAAAQSIRGRCGLRSDLVAPADAESIRDAKGWLSDHMHDPRRAYSPTVDQAGLTESFDFTSARSASSSFDKLLRELDRIFDAFARSAAQL